MTNIQIHPIALIIIGWYFYWTGKKGITTDSIVGEFLGLLSWLAVHPVMKWLIVKYSEGNIEVISFGVYFKFMMMFMLGRVVEWGKARRKSRD